jgi:hypothetical protein
MVDAVDRPHPFVRAHGGHAGLLPGADGVRVGYDQPSRRPVFNRPELGDRQE